MKYEHFLERSAEERSIWALGEIDGRDVRRPVERRWGKMNRVNCRNIVKCVMVLLVHHFGTAPPWAYTRVQIELINLLTHISINVGI